jgi:hypothetical protein
MSLRGLILLGLVGAVAVAGLSGLVASEPAVISLESGLGADVRTSRL